VVIQYRRFGTTYRYGINALRCHEFPKNAGRTNVFNAKRRHFDIKLHVSAREDRHLSLYKQDKITANWFIILHVFRLKFGPK